MSAVKFLIVGAGERGRCFANIIKNHPEKARVVGVAEPREFFRRDMAQQHDVPEANTFSDWTEAADREKFADAVLIATQDTMHVEPALRFAEKGYAMLLEKPMAPNEADCRRIYDAVKKHGNIFAVCHSMRYNPFTRQLVKVLRSGEIGQIMSIEHLEPVGYWHQAHSFVRGNWRNEKESSPMLLAKSCHDVDWLRFLAGRRCESVSSFGSLSHFCRAGKPVEAGHATRCVTDCAYEPQCPYSARKIYLGRARKGEYDWPVGIITTDQTLEGVEKALKDGPYGRCVYECDNDVVDHQVVNMEFEGGATASFTMTAFTEAGWHRQTRIFGTRGRIECDSRYIKVFDFLTDTDRTIDSHEDDAAITGGHGGGDEATLADYIKAVVAHDQSIIVSGPDQTLESHRMVFAAERSRREKVVVKL